MRTIDADALERDGWQMSRTVQIDKKTMEWQTRKPTDFPTIEPQRMRGKWETDAYGAMDDGEYLITRCSVCGTVYEYGHDDRYCGFCGAAMEAQDENN